MGLTPRLDLRPQQSLTLTPQLMQSIRLLQLSHLELNALIDAELLRNPLLEREEGESGADEPQEHMADPEPLQDMVEDAKHLPSANAIADGLDTAVENLFPEQPAQDRLTVTRSDSAFSEGEALDFDQFVAARPTLGDHLAAQAGLLLEGPKERTIGQALIESLNEDGYLSTTLDAIAAQTGADLEIVEAVLLTLQGCDPVGVFARDLAECLRLQLREKDRCDPLMDRLLDHLELLAAHDHLPLMRILRCDREDLLDMLSELRRLDPRPGRAFDFTPIQTAIPDVFVREGPGGSWSVELNTDTLPKVLVNRTYHAQVGRTSLNSKDKSFLADCLQSASWLTKSLEQRAQTILKVASEIVRQQDAFLHHGIAHLRPMTLKLVADAVGVHESTVSRVTSNKYMATPRGLFEMKYFFTTALGASDGSGEHSATAVRHRIRQLIEAEPPSAILSDDTIAEMLQREQGIEVARRTVAKYREGMNIPSSVIRRRQKRALVSAR